MLFFELDWPDLKAESLFSLRQRTKFLVENIEMKMLSRRKTSQAGSLRQAYDMIYDHLHTLDIFTYKSK